MVVGLSPQARHENDAAASAPDLQAPAGFKLSVVMPVYNEAATLREIVERVRSAPIPKELIIVDDGSTDGTREILKQLVRDNGDDLRVRYHDQNRGKGAALRTGLGDCRGDVVVIQDADLEYDPGEYPRLVEPILAGRADVVFGSRYPDRSPQGSGTLHRLANRALTSLSNVANRTALTDMETCYKAFRRELLEGMTLRENGFGIEPELTAKFARRHARICEVPITYDRRGYAAGKKIGVKDGLMAVWCIVRYRVAD